jgi:signal peptidase I
MSDLIENQNTTASAPVPAEVQENTSHVSCAPSSLKEKIKKESKALGLILLAVLVFRSIFFEPFRIPSGSMIPTLMIGDFILVNKFAYGIKVPFSDMFWNPIYIAGKSGPSRGDVIVFKYPQDQSINYIKRVIGIPGDTVEIRNKIVYINDLPLEAQDISDSVKGKAIMADMDDKFKTYNLKIFKTINGEHTHVVQQDSDNYYKVNYERRVVPAGQYFVMGDNRDFSYDSRFWGTVPHELIKGKALFVWFSTILPFSEYEFKFRPWRIGTKID